MQEREAYLHGSLQNVTMTKTAIVILIILCHWTVITLF